MKPIVCASLMALVALAACRDGRDPTAPGDSEPRTFDPSLDMTGPPDGGACPNVYYESEVLLDNGSLVRWTSGIAGFDYGVGASYVATVTWEVSGGTATYQGFTERKGPNTWTPRSNGGVEGTMSAAPDASSVQVTVTMSQMHQAGDDVADEWYGQIGNGHFWLLLDVDGGTDGIEAVKLGVTVHLEAPGEGVEYRCPPFDGEGDSVDDENPPTAPNAAPTAAAGPDQTVVDADGNGSEDVLLDGSGSSDPDGTLVSYTWSEAGGQIATGASPTVTLALGAHTITLTVTDDGGSTDTDLTVIDVRSPDAPNQPPTAAFGHSCVDLGCDFTDLSVDTDGSIAAWSWDFGDAAVSSGQHPSHVYAAAGTYTVTLTVTDDLGASDSHQADVTVSSAPLVSYAADIQPYFNANCVACHSNGGQKGVDLDSYANLMAGGDNGPLVVPGDPGQGTLIPQLEGGHMGAPHGTNIIDLLRSWITDGAPDN